MSFCTICGRVAWNKSDFCRYHKEALDGLQSSYELWRKASELSWDEYIEKLCQIDETGRWVLDVAEQIRSGDGLSTPT
ncbi:MAG: hypothetical protein KGD60_03165 [Candidatus Thorarchaeota archaeon]|nr:hypothetical protein [Candidatus Thorarchaeota archaeon]